MLLPLGLFRILKGHQIIGELRLTMSAAVLIDDKLKGHQIIGELRPDRCIEQLKSILKGHQIIGELRLRCLCFRVLLVIERSPDHW